MQNCKDKIHVIDDDILAIRVLEHVLGKKGYAITYSLNGDKALEFIEKAPPDLVLLDINMPGRDGYQVCRILKEDSRWHHIPVIFITSSNETSELIKGFEAGAVDFITKPVNLQELLVRINTHMELKKARDLIQRKNLALSRQIESRKQAEEKFKALSETTFEAVLFLEHNRIIEYNKAASALFGDKIGENKKASVFSFTNDDGSAILKKVLKNQDISGPWEMIFYKQNNQPFYGLVQYQTLAYKGSNVHVLAIRDITRQKEMDKEIFRAILEAEENERKRFSRDMHDGLGALLSTLKIYVGLLQKENKSDEDKAILMSEIKDTVSKAVESARTIANNIMPSVLMDHGIIKALRAFTDALDKTGAIKVQFSYPDTPFTIESNREGHIYRIALELINNTLKHANATQITFTIELKANKLMIYYADNGTGFDLAKAQAAGTTGQGLKNILSRVNFLNGKGEFQSLPGKGLNFHLVLPI